MAAAGGGGGGVGLCCNPNGHRHIFFYSHPPPQSSLPAVTIKIRVTITLLISDRSRRSSSSTSLTPTVLLLSATAPPPPLMAIVAHSSRTRSLEDKRQAARMERLWQQFFWDPSQWWDKRFDKSNLKYPDFKHKTAKRALWINNRFNPPWVHTRLATIVQCQEQGQSGLSTPKISGREVRMEHLWLEFFSDPSQWWDNRFIKKSSKYPDFKHKSTHEGLWIEGRLNPPWVRPKLATMAIAQIESGGGLRSRVPDAVRIEHNVSKLCQEGRLNEALHMVELMIQQNTKAPINAYVGLLKACARRKALAEGKRVHALILQSGLDSHILLGNNLVNMYGKCGSVSDARKVFNTMPEHNVFSWTFIISAYADHGQGEEALNLFQQMQNTGIAPDEVAYVVVLKICARTAALERGKQFHSDIIKCGLQLDVFLGSALVDMYSKCGCIELAHQVFNKMSERNVVSWSAMISGYAQNGLGNEAIALYEQMKQDGVQPNRVTYVVLLKACGNIGALEQGKQLHYDIIRSGFESDVTIGNTLVDMYAKCGCIELACQLFSKMSNRDVVSWTAMIAGYAKCGCIEHARQVFNEMSERSVVSWNSMIAGYAQNGLGKEALALYEQMKRESLQPNIVTYVSALSACASIAALEQGKQLHSDIIRSGFESDVTVGNTLVDMYAKCGCTEHAFQVFSKMSKRDVISWNSMIAGYEQNGLCKEALALYEQMKEEVVQPNYVTYAILLKACASIAALEQGKQLHSDIIKSGYESDVIVGNTLVDMYAKCGCTGHARQVFNKMSVQDVVSWTSMIVGYEQNELGKEALALYEQMKQEGVQPNIVTYVALLKACGSISALELGKHLHSEIIRSGFESDLIVGNTLIDMYAKCGCIEDAHQVFNKMSERNVVSWTQMIAGYAQQGLGKEALTLLERMQREGMKPDEATYVSVLSACSHSGLVDEGCHLFDFICKDHSVTLTLKHYACMVDLLGRAGCLADAEDFINKMPIQPDAVIWMTLLGSARNHGHVEIGRRAFECVVKLEPENAAAYVLLSNI